MVTRNVDNYLRNIIFSLEDVTLPDLVQNYKQYTIGTEKIEEISKKNFYSENYGNSDNSNNAPVKQTQSKKNCWRCNTQHNQGSCPAYGKVCKVCNDKNHFTGFCRKKPADPKKREEPKRPVCSKCGTNHPMRECPAFHETCQKCLHKGHYTNRCKNDSKDNPSSSKQNEASSNLFVNKVEDCLWCGTKHGKGECRHSANCTTCSAYPHNICFNCKKNPHDSTCYYYTIVTLPSKVPANQPATDSNARICLYCGVDHRNSPSCAAARVFCYTCKTNGHLPEHCHLSNLSRPNVNSSVSNTY